MRIILSPAKKMKTDLDGFAPEGVPNWLPETTEILAELKRHTPEQLQALWKCNASIAKENVERLEGMDLSRNVTAAILSYEGIQYRYLAPGVLEQAGLDYLREHLRIVSGFYGLLRPFDGIVPYRLEMQAKLSVGGAKDLYAFWGDKLAKQLAEESDVVVNLASKEYSRAVLPWLPNQVRVITCTFGEEKNGTVVEKGTLCKMARGQMVRWMAQSGIEQPERMQEFCDLGYRWSAEKSTQDHYVFLKGER
ncbi:MAG: peroxide stress protein YaaA [Lawsonibacter sp.]|jgi:cytoplasmic iron level regulating protein YaaA (DUF328/UPF0246 family)